MNTSRTHQLLEGGLRARSTSNSAPLDIATAMRKRTVESSMRGSFIVEVMVLLVALVTALAIVASLFMLTLHESQQTRYVQEAAFIADDIAERFAANPISIESKYQVGDYEVTCGVTPTDCAQGVFYSATISVSRDSDTLYQLRTGRYWSADSSSLNTKTARFFSEVNNG